MIPTFSFAGLDDPFVHHLFTGRYTTFFHSKPARRSLLLAIVSPWSGEGKTSFINTCRESHEGHVSQSDQVRAPQTVVCGHLHNVLVILCGYQFMPTVAGNVVYQGLSIRPWRRVLDSERHSGAERRARRATLLIPQIRRKADTETIRQALWIGQHRGGWHLVHHVVSLSDIASKRPAFTF